ncbi:MAG: hypothetical protein OES09_09800 [Gammaproteobacteria bacterium]|nr:hypothetical protein [Gammaproteobacteria bacterium]
MKGLTCTVSLALVLSLAVTGVQAGKDVFQRSKPHVNVDLVVLPSNANGANRRPENLAPDQPKQESWLTECIIAAPAQGADFDAALAFCYG